jgi:hypothetical protein
MLRGSSARAVIVETELRDAMIAQIESAGDKLMPLIGLM